MFVRGNYFFTIAYGDEDSIDCDDVGEDVSTGRAVVDERPIWMLITGLL